MSLSEDTTGNFQEDVLINLLLNHQDKFDTALTRMNSDLSNFRQDPSDLKKITLSWSQNLVLLGKSITN